MEESMTGNEPRPFGREQFVAALKALGMSRSGAARFLNVQPKTIYRRLSKDHKDHREIDPSIAMLFAAMVRYGLNPNELRAIAGLAAVELGDLRRKRRVFPHRVRKWVGTAGLEANRAGRNLSWKPEKGDGPTLDRGQDTLLEHVG
jgi:hypothetical protein